MKLENQLGEILEREKSFEGPLQQSVQDFDKCQDHAFHRFLKWLNFSHLFFCSFSSSYTHTRTISLPPSLSLVLTLSLTLSLSIFCVKKLGAILLRVAVCERKEKLQIWFKTPEVFFHEIDFSWSSSRREQKCQHLDARLSDKPKYICGWTDIDNLKRLSEPKLRPSCLTTIVSPWAKLRLPSDLGSAPKVLNCLCKAEDI